MKLLVNQKRIKIVNISIIFVSVIVDFIIIVILAHVTWALVREWVLSIRTAKTVTWVLTRDTTVLDIS